MGAPPFIMNEKHLRNIIRLKDITLSYDNGKIIFDEVSYSFIKGRFYFVKGKSGAGKTSFLRLLCRLEEPCSGEIFFEEKPYSQYLPPLLRKKILYMHQTPLIVDGSIRDNLLFPFSFKINQTEQKPDDTTLLAWFDQFMLKGVSLEDNARTLSVGQLQRLCLIRGLLLEPDVILLDEPTSALDEKSAATVEENAEKYCADQGKTVIMVSHKPFQLKAVSPHMLCLENGGIRED